MGIDAKVDQVQVNEDGSGVLHLVDRPARRGHEPGIRGQSRLTFTRAPAEVAELQGKLIRGSDAAIMLGDRMIAMRLTTTSIKFVTENEIQQALGEYSDIGK